MAPLPLGDLTPLAIVAALMLYVRAGIVFDLAVLRRIHPAYWWGGGTMAAVQLLTGPVGFGAPVSAFAERLAG